MIKEKKKFDCVKLKNKIQSKLYKELSPSSIDNYFDKIKKYSKKTALWKKLNKNKSKILG